jgi:hypothetical protein
MKNLKDLKAPPEPKFAQAADKKAIISGQWALPQWGPTIIHLNGQLGGEFL